MLKIQKASAGSGKTFALTRQYLLLLLGERPYGHGDADEAAPYRLRNLSGEVHPDFPSPHGEILAVTFTHKATDEMTDRIVRELAKLSELASESDHRQYLIDTFNRGLTPSDKAWVTPEKLAANARTALREMLLTFSEFNVKTIDSFFQDIVQTFTRELELPPVPVVEISEKGPVHWAVNNLLQQINQLPLEKGVSHEQDSQEQQRQFLVGWIEDFMRDLQRQGDDVKLLTRSSGLWSALTAAFSALMQETYKLNRQRIDDYLTDLGRVKRFAAFLRSLSLPCKELEAKAREIKQYDAYRLVPSNARKIIDQWAAGNVDVSPFGSDGKAKAIPSMLDDPKGRHNTLKKGDTWPQDYENRLVELCRLAVDHANHAAIARKLLPEIYRLGLFGLFNRSLQKYREDNGSIILSDTNDLLREVVSEDEASFVYERMGTFIHHYLIDEFQDTSRMQWENLSPLVRDSMADSHDNLIIGDEKQSIYRFRNAAPQMLGHEVEEEITGRFHSPAVVEVSGIDIAENTNWRSAPEIVRFNNSLFLGLTLLADGGAPGLNCQTYRNLIQQTSSKNSRLGGMVRLAVGLGKREEKADFSRQSQLPLLASEIARQLRQGYRPGDITVLVRTHNQGEEVTSYLMESMADNPQMWPAGEPVRVVSVDALRVSACSSVRLIVSVLRLIAAPERVVDSRASALKGEVVETDNPAFRRARMILRFELERHREGVSDNEALNRAIAATAPGQEDAQQREIDAKAFKVKEMDCPTLAAITERIIEHHLSAEARRRDAVYIAAFQDLVLDRSDNLEPEIDDFLRWWDEQGGKETAISMPQDSRSLTVMTIHSAKGLEFPCVHVPYFDSSWPQGKGSSYDWYPLRAEEIDPSGQLSAADIPPLIPLMHSTAKKIELPAVKEASAHWLAQENLEAMNLAYVAFTRASRELNVYGFVVQGKGNIPDMMLQAVEQSTADTQTADALSERGIQADAANFLVPLAQLKRMAGFPGHAPEEQAGPAAETSQEEEEEKKPEAASDKETVFLQYGKPTVPKNKTKDKPDPGDPISLLKKGSQDGEFGEYVSKERKDDQFISVADLSRLVRFDINRERDRGVFLHAVMAGVDRPADLRHSLWRLAARYDIPPSLRDEFFAKLSEAMADERVKPWFAPEVVRSVNERPMLHGERRRRPDRAVWLSDGSIAVIDYKFGDYSSLQPKQLQAYRRQVRGYCAALAAAGHPGARPYLWFPLSGQVLPG